MFCNYSQYDYVSKKGHTFKISFMAVAQVGNPVNATILSSFVTESGRDRFKEGQAKQEIGNRCTELEYNIFSRDSSAQVELYAEGPCINFGISKQLYFLYPAHALLDSNFRFKSPCTTIKLSSFAPLDHPLDPPLLAAEHFQTVKPQYVGVNIISSNFHTYTYLVALLSGQYTAIYSILGDVFSSQPVTHINVRTYIEHNIVKEAIHNHHTHIHSYLISY